MESLRTPAPVRVRVRARARAVLGGRARVRAQLERQERAQVPLGERARAREPVLQMSHVLASENARPLVGGQPWVMARSLALTPMVGRRVSVVAARRHRFVGGFAQHRRGAQAPARPRRVAPAPPPRPAMVGGAPGMRLPKNLMVMGVGRTDLQPPVLGLAADRPADGEPDLCFQVQSCTKP